MKHQLKYLSLCFLAATLLSCEDDEAVIETREVGANAVLADNHISVLDRNEDVTIELFSNNVNFETVSIEDGDGNQITTATVSDGVATFNTSAIGDEAFEDGSFDFRIVSTLSNGEILDDPASISIDHAISLDDNPTTASADTYAAVELGYAVSTFAATVDEVNLSVKEGSETTYQPTALELSTEEGTVELGDIDLAGLGITLEVGDTLYYQFTAMSGELSDSAESYVAIVPKDFQTSHSATLSSDLTMNQLNLMTGELSADGDESGEIAFVEPAGFTVIGDSDLTFVLAPDSYLENADVLSAKEFFEAGVSAGEGLTTVTDLSKGDTYIYSTTRAELDEDGEPTGETVTVYGVITVESVTTTTTDGVEVTTIDLSFWEGV